MRALLPVLALYLSGCVAEAPEPLDPPGGSSGSWFGLPLPEHEHQGEHLLGGIDAYLDDTAGEHLWFPNEASSPTDSYTLVLAGTELRAQKNNNTVLAGLAVWGLELERPGGTRLRINGVVPPVASGDPWLYKVIIDDGAGYVDPCNTEAAVAVAGRYTATDQHLEPDGDITFSCTSGVVYKCIDFSYEPGTDPTSSMWALHKACTRMAKANYCADGKSYTREGTRVSMFDAFDVREEFPSADPVAFPNGWLPWQLQSWPPPVGEYYVEAAWLADGTPRCLAKARWASLENDICGEELPDPRTQSDGDYCEEIGIEALAIDPDVLIINTSLYNDVPFTTWRMASGDYLTTMQYYYDPEAPPTPGRTYVGSSDVLLRALTAEIDKNDLKPVRRYCNAIGTRCVVTTPATKPLFHNVDQGIEGFVFKKPRGGTTPLRLYNAGGDYVTATFNPDPAVFAGGGIVIGHVFKTEIE